MVPLLRGGDPSPVSEVEVDEGWLQCTLPHVMDVNREVVIGVLWYGKSVITKGKLDFHVAFVTYERVCHMLLY